MQCRHLDGDRANNRASNLAWGTPRANYEDAVLHGTATIGFAGETHPGAKLTDAQAAELRRRYLAGESASALGREYLCTEANVRKIGNGRGRVASRPAARPAREPNTRTDDER
jgi:hypothetical protein